MVYYLFLEQGKTPAIETIAVKPLRPQKRACDFRQRGRMVSSVERYRYLAAIQLPLIEEQTAFGA